MRKPRHIAMIMDGNGRWALQRGKPRLAGHEAGAETIRRVLRYCRDAGVEILTLYAFSVENWHRPSEEISGLMQLFGFFLRNEEAELHENKVRLRIIGRREDLSDELNAQIRGIEERTKAYSFQLILAVSYGARTEITSAVRELARRVSAGELAPEAIDEQAVAECLYAPDVPDPDLIVRTSGEMRLSNFLLWQAAYSELHVTPVLWPDFGEDDFKNALKAFAERDRRFGGHA